MTTVSGARAGEGMFPILTRGDGFAVDDFGPVGGTRHGELAPRQHLTGARDARPKRVVAEHPVESSGPCRGIERRDEEAPLTPIHELRIAPPPPRDPGDPQRQRPERL